jgi:hypothetical protein
MPVPIWMKNVTMVKINVAHSLKCLYPVRYCTYVVRHTVRREKSKCTLLVRVLLRGSILKL